MKENISDYHAVILLSESLGVAYIIDPIISPTDDGKRNVLDHRLGCEDLKKIYMEQFKEIHEAGDMKKDGFPCEAGSTFGSISSNGDVYPCIQLPKSIGNVFKRSFKDIWRGSDILEKIRNAQNEDSGDCADCDISESCTRCPGLAFIEDGDMFGPYSLACFIAGVSNDFKVQEEKSRK